MTVCIGAIAAKSKAIVMLADKALTYGAGGPAMQFDTGIRKIIPIGPSGWYALVAGDASFAGDVIECCKKLLAKSTERSHTAPNMMQCVKEGYQQCRETAITDQILTPNLLDKRLLMARPKDMVPLPPDHFSNVASEVHKYDSGTSLLICGFDGDKNPQPHIFSVSDPGIYHNHDLAGFHAIGIGEETAVARLLRMEVDRNDDLSKALYAAFEAKVNAEIIQGVGTDWDAEILVAGRKSVRVTKPIIALIDRVYDSFARSPFEHFGAEPKNWHKTMGKFARSVIPSSPDPDVVHWQVSKKKKSGR